MRMCDLNTGKGQLMRATKRLKEAWSEAKADWNDATSRKFEETFLRPLSPEMHLVVAAIHRLADVLEQAEAECEDPDRAE